MRIIIVGPQGVGKGTQAKIIAHSQSIAHISTGDLFRFNMENETPLGLKVKEIINKGELVSDAITNELVADRLQQGDIASGWILDGYPRNVGQVEYLDGFLKKRNEGIDIVIYLVAPKSYLVSRINKRAQEEGRSDDTEVAITKRLEEYEKQTKPIIDVYEQRGLVKIVDSTGSVDDISKMIRALLLTV